MMLRQSVTVIVTLALFCWVPYPSIGAPQGDPAYDEEGLDLESDDLNGETDWENLDLDNYGENFDYDDSDQESPWIEVGTVPPNVMPPAPEIIPPTDEVPDVPEYEEEVTLGPPPVPVTLDFKGPNLFGPESGLDMPACLLCVCVRGSVYCDDNDLDQVPPLPKDTTHFYARFNKIRHIKNTDFINLNNLKRIDLTGNQISEIDEDAFAPLPQLQEVLLADNNLQALPELPVTMTFIDVRNNRLISGGIHPEGFKDMSQLEFLYLSHNQLNYVPAPLPQSLRVLHLQYNNVQSLHVDTFCNQDDRNYIRRKLEDIRLDGNPVDINLYASSYICLPRLPVGSGH